MSVLRHALCLKGGFGSAETRLKMKQLVQMMRSMLFTLYALHSCFLRAHTFPAAEQHSAFILTMEPKD